MLPKERVRSAIINAGLDFPTRRITVNLPPADPPKAGGRYDLAIVLSITIVPHDSSRGSSKRFLPNFSNFWRNTENCSIP